MSHVAFSRKFLCLLISSSFALHAQVITASLEGIVTDGTGAVVPAAKVGVINTATNVTTSLVTDAAGRFLALSVPPGSYEVDVEAAGFKRARRSGIVLQV